LELLGAADGIKGAGSVPAVKRSVCSWSIYF
jgi:hypothetical protein